MDSITNRQIPQHLPTGKTTSFSTTGQGSGQTATNFNAHPENMSTDNIAAAAKHAAAGSKNVIKDPDEAPPPLNTGFIYDSFMNGSTGIAARQANLSQTVKLGVIIQEAQALAQNILNSLLAAVSGTVDSNGTINISSSNTINLADTKVTISYKDADGNPATKEVPVNDAIEGYNAMLTGIQKVYKNAIYPTAKENNPGSTLPPTLNLPDPLLPVENKMTPAEAQAALQPFQSNVSQLVNVSKNFSLGISQQQQKLNNAQQGLSATLKILMSMIMGLLNNMS